MVAIEVDEFLAVDGWRIDEGGLLRVVDKVACVYT
jgi:hypothetical protein